MLEDELSLLYEAHRRATDYLCKADEMPVFPGAGALAALDAFDEPLPAESSDPADTLRLLDEIGSPATSVS
ncbi:MAG: aspartate aminotransferase family protein, partial [bacterium]|nr:aspartate aminotransferase family protein [bacterium]